MELFQKQKVSNIICNYNKNIFESLDNNIDILINAFTNYYGEEYRNVISEKIHNILFFTFISTNIIDLMENGYNKLNQVQKDLHKDFYKIIKYYKKKNKFAYFFENNVTLTGNFKKQIIKTIKSDNDSCAFQLSNIDINYKPIYTIFLGIGTNDQTIIHEINHVITNSILAYTNSNIIEIIEKIGITNSINMKQGEALEEILNDKAAYDITDIFHKLGGEISKYNLYSIDAYPLLFPLINKFYYNYNNLIKKARISDNQNILFSEIEKTEFEKYQIFINEELNYIIKNHTISHNSIQKANEIFNKLAIKNQKKEDINYYINELQKQKRIIKLLNNQNDNFLSNTKTR